MWCIQRQQRDDVMHVATTKCEFLKSFYSFFLPHTSMYITEVWADRWLCSVYSMQAWRAWKSRGVLVIMLSPERRWRTWWSAFFFFFFAVFPSWSAHSAGIVIWPVSCGRRLLSASPPLSQLPLFPGSNNGFFSAS